MLPPGRGGCSSIGTRCLRAFTPPVAPFIRTRPDCLETIEAILRSGQIIACPPRRWTRVGGKLLENCIFQQTQKKKTAKPHSAEFLERVVRLAMEHRCEDQSGRNFNSHNHNPPPYSGTYSTQSPSRSSVQRFRAHNYRSLSPPWFQRPRPEAHSLRAVETRWCRR